ncbi:MAG: histidine kinase [Spirochaetales bacterium]|nr:histidine kinase [Spirochaetales bacterium]
METALICNIILDGCGVLILSMLFISCLSGDGRNRTINRRKRNLLLYAVLMHLFVLFFRLAGEVSVKILSHSGATVVFSVSSILPFIVSFALVLCCILCDETGRIRIPKGRGIPLGQIACTVLPPVVALCLRIVFPELGFLGLAWAVVLQLNHYIIQADSEKQIEDAEQKLGRDQALLMTVQMQPHFIFNTLSSIEAMCLTDPSCAAESLENLSGYLRSNIDALTSEALISFDDELRHIRQYIALELADPARQFNFEYELDVRDFSLPALTVQPVVENAVKHGALSHRDGTGCVTLTTEKFGKHIRITVTDNGTDNLGLTDSQREHRGIGIENTRKRLAVFCGGSLEFRTGKAGTKAIILIPQKGA